MLDRLSARKQGERREVIPVQLRLLPARQLVVRRVGLDAPKVKQVSLQKKTPDQVSDRGFLFVRKSSYFQGLNLGLGNDIVAKLF